MFLQPVARRRIGSSPFCVRKGWFISCASRRSPPTIITTRRFRQSSIRCGLENRKKFQRGETEKQRTQSKEEKHEKILKQEEGVTIQPVRPLRFAFDLCIDSKVLPPHQRSLEEERQNGGALFLYGLKPAGIDAQRLQDCRRDLRGGHRGLHNFGTQTRVRNNEADVGVTEPESSGLGILLGRPGVDDAVNRLYP